MPLYRALRALSKKHDEITPRGAIVRLEWLNEEQIAKLVQCGAISRVKPPPLHVIPGWKLRAGKLHKVGITDTEQFLEADNEALAEKMEVKPATIEQWKADLWTWLIVREPEYRG